MLHTRKKTIEIILICLTTAVMSATIFIPYCTIYFPSDTRPEDENWKLVYIWDDLLMALIYFAIIFLWVIYLVIKNQRAKTIVKVMLLIISTLAFLSSVEGIGLPIQDFMPYYGTYISLLILPLIVIYLVYLRIVKQSLNKGS